MNPRPAKNQGYRVRDLDEAKATPWIFEISFTFRDTTLAYNLVM